MISGGMSHAVVGHPVFYLTSSSSRSAGFMPGGVLFHPLQPNLHDPPKQKLKGISRPWPEFYKQGAFGPWVVLVSPVHRATSSLLCAENTFVDCSLRIANLQGVSWPALTAASWSFVALTCKAAIKTATDTLARCVLSPWR